MGNTDCTGGGTCSRYGVCVQCPDGLSTHGIGGWGLANCTGDVRTSSTTPPPVTTPTPERPRGIHGMMNADLKGCSVDKDWSEMAAQPDFKRRFATGGLGKMMTRDCRTWLCDRWDACVPGVCVCVKLYVITWSLCCIPAPA